VFIAPLKGCCSIGGSEKAEKGQQRRNGWGEDHEFLKGERKRGAGNRGKSFEQARRGH